MNQPLPAHGLRWAIKTSFVGYVARMPDGRAYVGSGAGVNEHNELIFPWDEETSSAPGTFSFGGAVRFSGHYGLLLVQIAHPRVEMRDGRGEMTVLDPGCTDGRRMRLVTFGLAGPEHEDGLDRWEATDVRLAPEGVDLFGDVYPAGEQFDPLTITIPRRGGNHG